MLIRGLNTGYRLEAGTDPAGKLQMVISWAAQSWRKPTADEQERLEWMLAELRRVGLPAVVHSAPKTSGGAA